MKKKMDLHFEIGANMTKFGPDAWTFDEFYRKILGPQFLISLQKDAEDEEYAKSIGLHGKPIGFELCYPIHLELLENGAIKAKLPVFVICSDDDSGGNR